MTDHDAAGDSADVRWQVDGIRMHGTLVRPASQGPFPAVVMVAGSGPTDRDWNSPLLPGSNGSARLLAEALAEHGFASLRYDKRVTGPDARANAQALLGKLSMQSHLDELTGAVRTLAGQDDIRADRIFGLGNSEGTLHVLNYAGQQPAIPMAGLILLAPPGRSVGAVAHAQMAEQAASIPNGAALLALWDAAIERFLAGEPLDPDPALPEGARNLLLGLASPANLPFSRELWVADAATLLRQVDVPVLVLIGKKDVQVDWQADGAPLQRAAAGRQDVSFLFPEDANHVFKYEPRPRAGLATAAALDNYNGPAARLDPQALTSICAWLTAHT
jgi:dienelactone hydrolase